MSIYNDCMISKNDLVITSRSLFLNIYNSISCASFSRYLFYVQQLCYFYFTCSREKGLLFTVFCEIGKEINVQEIFNCSFIVKWQYYFAFFRADTTPLRPSYNTYLRKIVNNIHNEKNS